jgi:hypothetical protein
MKWFRRKSGRRSIPDISQEPERYADRPLLIVLEAYVLDCIGELRMDRQEAIAELVNSAFGGDDDWKQTIRRELDLLDTLDDNIRGLWARNQQIAKQAKTTLHPAQFARMIVDESFAHLVD